MSCQYKVCPLFWEDYGDYCRLHNQNVLEDLLNDGWKISRVDVMSLTRFPSGAVSATNVYILEKQSEDTKKSSVSEPLPHDMGLRVGLLPHDMGLRVELDTNETCFLKSGWEERCDSIYGLACGYEDRSHIFDSWFEEKPVPVEIMRSHVKLAVPFDEHATKTTARSEDTNMKETNR